MKKYIKKELAEIVGVISIVAGLVFVGVQIKQSRDIALSQSLISYSSIRIEALAEINNHIEVWEKGNAGEPLTLFEESLYLNLVDSINDMYFYSSASQLLADGKDPTPILFSGDIREAGLQEWAYFLSQNPGALEALIKLENDSQEARTVLDIQGENTYLTGLIKAVDFFQNEK